MVLAFAIGLVMRLSRSATLRGVIMWIALARQAIPVFWFGLMLILLFSVCLRWLPSLGRGGIAAPHLAGADARDLRNRALPAALQCIARGRSSARTTCARPMRRGRRIEGAVRSHAAERAAAARHDRRHQSRPAARRNGGDRDGVQLAGRRPADRAIGQPARLSGHHRGRVRRLPDLRRGQPDRRPALRLPRSAREASHEAQASRASRLASRCCCWSACSCWSRSYPSCRATIRTRRILAGSLLAPFEQSLDGQLVSSRHRQARTRHAEPPGARRPRLDCSSAFRRSSISLVIGVARPDRRLFSRLGRERDHGHRRPAAVHSARAAADRRDGDPRYRASST